MQISLDYLIGILYTKILKEGEYFYQDLEQNAWFNLNGLELCVFACDSINHKSVGGRKWMYVKEVCIEKK